jgi:hypothetical protein
MESSLRGLAEQIGLIRSPKQPVVFRVQPFDLMCRTNAEVESLARSATDFVAGLESDFRMLAYTQPVEARQMVSHVVDVAQKTPERWKRQELSSYGRALRKVVEDSVLQRVAFYFLTWNDGSSNPATQASQLAYAFAHTPVTIVDGEGLPSLLGGTHVERPGYLEPLSPTDDYVAIVQSYKLHGSLVFGQVASSILRKPYPVAYAVDVRTIPRDEAIRQFTFKLQKSDNMMEIAEKLNASSHLTREAQQEAELVVQDQGWTVHRVTVAVAVKAPSEEALERRVQDVLATLRRQQIMARPATGQQKQILQQFFTVQENGAGEIDSVMDDAYHSMVSRGPALLAPYGHYVRDEFDGVMYGIARSGYPVFVDRWSLRSYNEIVTGQTGAGKTFSKMVHALRGTLLNDEQWVILDPQGNAGEMTRALNGSYNRLSLAAGTAINPLDIVEDNLASQNSHVLTLLETMLDTALTPRQKAAIDEALTTIYAQLDDDTPREEMPTLEALIHAIGSDLPDFRDSMYRFVDGSLAGIFNRPTSLDLRMEAPIVTYDLQDIPKEFEALFSYVLLRSIERWLRRRRKRQRVGILVDELGVMSKRHPSIKASIVELFKRIRNWNGAVVAMDQNATTFLEMPDVLENAAIKLFFHADTDQEAERIQSAFRLTDYYKNVLLNADRGEGVLLLGRRDLYHVNVVPTGREFSLLARQPRGDEWVLWG